MSEEFTMKLPNIIMMTDSYKLSHHEQYPEGTTILESYVEARGGADKSVFFGQQAWLKDYMGGQVLEQWMIDEARPRIQAHGFTFNEDWQEILDTHEGRIPVRIFSVAEGTYMETQNAQTIISNTDPRFPWLVSHIETMMLRAIWYPSTVATLSKSIRDIIYDALDETADDPDAEIDFKLHDFGARGTTCHEQAKLGGMAHLVNFKGTDTLEGITGAEEYYGPVEAFSIPASEHSTMTAWGREGELAAYTNLLDKYPTGLVACVSDSYDIWNAVDNLWGVELRDRVMERDGTLVVRPDSGDPVETPVKVIERLMKAFGYYTNTKGYKVLPEQVRVLQGDGIGINEVKQIIELMKKKRLSLSNIAFGMGGGLLQAPMRDDLQYAQKASAALINEVWVDVFKDPISGGKTSKKGRLMLIKEEGVYKTLKVESPARHLQREMNCVFNDGYIMKTYTMQEVIANAKKD